MDTRLFTKTQGIGNDYVFIDSHLSRPCYLASPSREMSDRHSGVGGDGIIHTMPSSEADFKMRTFSSFNTEARMCYTGTLSAEKYACDNNLTCNHHLTLETASGVKYLYLKPGDGGLTGSVTVDMGLSSLLTKKISVSSYTPFLRCTFISHNLI